MPLFNGIKLTCAENARKLGKTERGEQGKSGGRQGKSSWILRP